MSKLKITDNNGVFSMNTDETGDSITSDGTAKNAHGGTELMREALYKHVNNDLLSKVQIISTRVRKIEEDKPKILWIHDTANDPEVQHLRDSESIKRFDHLVFVSNYQMHTFNMALGVPFSKSTVIKNAIEPIEPHTKPDDGIIRLIYHTTPHRGLEILVPVFDKLTEFHPNIHLDVYSSFEMYGWGHRDKEYKELFETIRNHPKMTYHGFQSNDVIRDALKNSHIFAYPSIWQETSCIAAIEALSAGCAVVCPNYGALFETTANWAVTYQWSENFNEHANRFAYALKHVIEAIEEKAFNGRLEAQKNYYDNFYDWSVRKYEWEGLLTGLTSNV